jgi:hypothetical protein
VDGVISAAGPTDLPALPPRVRGWAAAAFGAAGLERFSPVARAARLTMPLLLEYGRLDPLVPPSQGRALDEAVAAATLVDVPAILGGRSLAAAGRLVRWVHGSLWPAADGRLATREHAWLAEHCSA